MILPTLNEAENLEDLIGAIEKNLVTDILVIDDNSPDGTGDIADRLAGSRPHVHVIHRPGKLGLGTAYVCGFEWGLVRGYERLIEMDCDFSHPPERLPDLVQASEAAGLALGSRYVPGGGTPGWSTFRRIVSVSANLYSRIVLGLPVRDSTGGFRCYQSEVLRRLVLERATARGYAFQVQMTWLVKKVGGHIQEIPIQFTERRVGQSKMSFKIALEAVFAIPMLRIRSWFQSERAADDESVTHLTPTRAETTGRSRAE